MLALQRWGSNLAIKLHLQLFIAFVGSNIMWGLHVSEGLGTKDFSWENLLSQIVSRWQISRAMDGLQSGID